jgi:type IV pilus assembly protein PilE
MRLVTSTGSRSPGSWSKAASGFTLLELMITVAIIAILSTIAYASYTNQVVKSRRAAAANCLQERAQFMERFYTTRMTYEGAPNPAQCGPDLDAFYTVAFNGAPDGKTFVIQATPQGGQASGDAKCAVLGINAQGTRTASGTAASTPGECW